MRTRVSYPIEVKMKAIEMKLKGISTKTIMVELNILNDSQVKTWMRWYRNGELHRLEQPVGKQYTFGKGPEFVKQNVDCVLDTLNQLPELTSTCLLHSDQGSVYTSHIYQEAIKRKGITIVP